MRAFASDPRLHLRLYGGWFEQTSASRRAQLLAAEVARFPHPVVLDDGAAQLRVITSAELAYGPIDEPRLFFTHTFRRRASFSGLECKRHPLDGCGAPDACALGALPSFLSTNVCPTVGCNASTATTLLRAEQKLTDTLIVADLLSIARRQEIAAGLVSNDDDMWPGIRAALNWGLAIYHVHPVIGRHTPTHYIVSMPKGYHQATMS